jgi:hypothetical protein
MGLGKGGKGRASAHAAWVNDGKFRGLMLEIQNLIARVADLL